MDLLVIRHGIAEDRETFAATGADDRQRPLTDKGRRRLREAVPGVDLTLTTNGSALKARARALREHGSTTRYYHDEVGFNYRMEGIQGAVLRIKLKHLQDWTRERRRVARRYEELLTGTPLQLPHQWRCLLSAKHQPQSAQREIRHKQPFRSLL